MPLLGESGGGAVCVPMSHHMASREGEGTSNKTGLKPRANRTKIAKEELCLKLLANAHLFCLNITWLYRDY